jgi:hypothetical protein
MDEQNKSVGRSRWEVIRAVTGFTSETDDQNKSVGWVGAVLALTVAYFGWGFLAWDYHPMRGVSGGRNTYGAFLANAITQLPNFARVVRHGLENRLWLLIVIGVAEVGVLILWLLMRKLDRELWGEPRRRSRRRRARA